MPGAAKTRTRAGRFFDVLTVLVLVSLGPPILLYLAFLTPSLSFAYFFLWLSGLIFDFYTTWRFYADDPGKFDVRERSVFMKWLNRKFGFKTALIAFAVLVEAPAALFISFICVPLSADLISAPFLGTRICVATGLALLGLIHLQAAMRNLSIEVAEKKAASIPSPFKG